MPQAARDALSTRSCRRCHERKVRCDRKLPCGRCLQAKSLCSYPENRRAPRKLKRPPIATILGQLAQLEQELERLRASSDTNDENSMHTGVGQQGHLQVPTPGTQVSTSCVVKHHPRSKQAVCADNNYEATTGRLPLLSIGILGFNSQQRAGAEAEASYLDQLQPLQIQALWNIYKGNVAPMIALLHKRSFEGIIQEACTSAGPTALVAASKALVLAVCFAATVSTTPVQCLSIFGQDRDVCIRTSLLAVEHALARANLISSQEIYVLQAAVLFLLCLRWLDSGLAWAETAIVVRVAQRQGVHRDGQFSGLSPFDIEMRRRLWWHICILDMLCSEDQGTDTQIRPGSFSTKTPSNVDIDDLVPEMTRLPSAQEGFTDITLCIIQCEMIINLYWAGINLNPEAVLSPMPDQENILSSLASRIEEQYLREFDLEVPIQWLTAVIARLSLSKARVVSLLNNSPAEVPIATNDEIFHIAVEIVKFALLIQKNEPTSQWAWLCKSYKQRHAVAFILSELCVRPISPETNQAWEIATEMYNQWREENDKMDSMLQNTLSHLMERATISRTRKLESINKARNCHSSLPVPRSIIPENLSTATPVINMDVEHSAATGSAGIVDLSDVEARFSLPFSAMDWLSGTFL